MPVVTLKFNKFPKKSISLPCRSHPTTFQIEESLNKIKSSSTSTTIRSRSADNICDSLSQLVDLYNLVNHLLVLPAGTQNLIFLHSKWVQDVMNGSLKLLDICNSLRDLVLQMQEHFQDLQYVLRRSRTDHIETSVAKYNSFRKKTKKDAKEFIMSLKQTEKVVGYLVTDLDSHHLAAVIRVLMEVTEVTISIFESLLMYLSSAPVLQTSGWPLVVSKLMHNKGSAGCRVVENDIEGIDVLLLNIVRNGGGNKRPESMQIAQVRLEGMRKRMQGIESGLECMFRILLKTRASLLNIMSLKILSCSRLIH